MVTRRRNAVGVCCVGVAVLSLITSGCGPGPLPSPTMAPTLTPIPTLVPPPTLTSNPIMAVTSTAAPIPTLLPRAPLSAADVKALAAEFKKTASQQAQAWDSRDLDAIRQLYTDDIVHYDGYPRFVGIDEVMSMVKSWMVMFPRFRGRLADIYVGRDDGVDVWQLWDMMAFTQEKPWLEYDQLKTRAGRIWYWRLWYSPDTLAQIGTDVVDRKLLESYGGAWSSGNPQAVAALYAPGAVREDSLFSERQQGQGAIQAFAARFFAWYPKVQVELLQPFGETDPGDSRLLRNQGGVYAIQVADAAEKPCDVRTLVLLQPSATGVVSETVYYNAESLIACNWATPGAAANRASAAMPTLGVGSTTVSDKDGMTLMYVPAGDFLMGTTKADLAQLMENENPAATDADIARFVKMSSANSDSVFFNEMPQHIVYLDAFWIDQTEVTQRMYANCVAAGKCQKPTWRLGGDNYPEVAMAWNDATAYCMWAGRRLPTEAEWEKAARGTDGRLYPWGNQAPDSTRLTFDYGVGLGQTTEVGIFPTGASPYGALDMAGNVFEWVADWYDETYYVHSPARNPTGPASGYARVMRGGAWESGAESVRAAVRGADSPDYQGGANGFRCARSVSP